MQHGHVYALGFDTSNVTFGRSEGDLLMTFEDGANLILRDFYNESEMGDFFLELADGNVLSARSIVASMEYVLDDFVSDTEPVYTAESYQAGHEGASSILSVLGDEAPSLLAQSMAEGSILDGLVAEGSISANSGTLTPVGEGASVFEHQPQPALIASDHAAHGQKADNPFSQQGQGQDLFLDHEDEGSFAAFAVPSPDINSSADIITPRAHADGEINPFAAHLGSNAGDGISQGTSRAQVFLAKNAKEADLLLLEDLLDTTMPEELGTNVERVPAFEDLFASGHDEGISMKIEPLPFMEFDHMNTVTASDSVGEGSEQLLLAFLRMGSF